MRIGFFADTYYPQLNGVATSVGYFASILKKAGHQVIVVAPKIKGYQDQQKDVLRIPSSKLWPTIPDSVRLPLPIPSLVWWKIFQKDYDIIHAHGNGLFSLIGLMVARKKKIPFVLTFHTHFNKYTHYILKGKIISPKTVDSGMKRFANMCDGVIAPSEKMKQELISIGVHKPIKIIPNFIDTDKFKLTTKGFLHSKFNIPKDHHILLSVGRLGKEKNFEFIINTFARLAKQAKIAQKNKKVQLVIVGEGNEKQNLLNLVKKLRLQEKVTFTGSIDINLMPDVYSDADIFVFASTTESQGMVAWEAASVGLPLILVKDPSYEDIIEDGVNGFVVPLEKEAFVDKISLLLNNSDMRKGLGDNSIKIVKSKSQEKDLIFKLINLYNSCLKARQQH